MNNYDVAVIGAGPYGLSVAAHLREQSLKVIVFGRPMSFWDRNMPVGMLLRSPLPAVPARIIALTFPQCSLPRLLTAAACGGLGSTSDCRTRRTSLHLSYSCALTTDRSQNAEKML